MNVKALFVLLLLMCATMTGFSQVTDDPNAPPPEYVAYDRAPEPQKLVQPKYPSAARSAGAEGTVWVKVWVGKTGKVRKALVNKTDSPLLNEAAVEAAEQWVFSPAIARNNPVEVWVSVPFKFRLTK
jgi:protein TonB